ncbi:hypothetical protein GCM10008986_25820 [Salinibacillus aidingensis]|uniref:Uncharacterized protein n=1 Tax=Salinibacillus aidingensis TaxID=237684 RepID=A0ABN1BH13_9BACI
MSHLRPQLFIFRSFIIRLLYLLSIKYPKSLYTHFYDVKSGKQGEKSFKHFHILPFVIYYGCSEFSIAEVGYVETITD